MKRVIISLSIIAAAAAIVIGATTSFFSDTETSSGNTFTAGAIDLKIDNESYVTNNAGVLVASPNTSWTLSDLTGQLFFNFSDLKPGDIGEDTISLHVDDNDSWLCAAARVTEDSDVTYSEPELTDDNTENLQNPLAADGELAENLNFVFWADDGDNVYESDETDNVFVEGSVADLNRQGKITLADSHTNVWNGATAPGPLPGDTTKYIGKAWCFGTLSKTPVNQDNSTTNGPLEPQGQPRGTGFDCSGAQVNNAAQTDRVMGDLQFYAVQSRNNTGFTCSSYDPNWRQNLTLILENKDTEWDVINETGSPEIQGTLTYNTQGDTFDYTFQATGLAPSINYSLIYYADEDPRFQSWGGDNPGAVIGTFSSDTSGSISVPLTSINLGIDLPAPQDWNNNPDPDYCDNHNNYDDYNRCAGAKIWLVPSSALTNGTSLPLISWNPSTYLFETDLILYNDTNN